MSVTADAAPARLRAAPAMPNRWGATVTVMLGMMTTVMSSTMVNIAVPEIMGTFGIGQDQAHWMSTAFLSAMTVFMLLNAWFITNLGPRNTFLIAMAVFVGASIFGQVVPGYYGLVAARAIQGACAGLLQPLALNVIFGLFPPEERGKGMGIFGMGVVLGPALGPTAGGFIVDSADWRFVFSAALPICVLAAGMGMRLLPGRDDSVAPARMNWTSFALVGVALASFLTAISNGQREGWESPFIFGLLLTSATAAVVLFLVESVSRHPLIQVRLFAVRAFAVSAVVAFMFGAGMFGSMYLLPVFLQTVAGYTAVKAGLLLMVAGLAMVPVFPLGGRLAQDPHHLARYPWSGYPIAAGMFLFAVSAWVFSGADADSAFWFLAGWATFGRIGLGLVVPSLNIGAIRDLPRELLPYGAGTLNFIRMLGGATGVNVLAVTLEQRAVYHADHLAATQTADNPVTRELLQRVTDLLAAQGVGAAEQLPLAIHYLGRVVSARAEGHAFQDGFLLLSIGFFIASATALLLVRRIRAGAASGGLRPAAPAAPAVPRVAERAPVVV